MKTLKFMLAAATAIGLASATQAAVDTYASTGFEKLAVGTSVTNGVKDNDSYTYFYYAGANAEDNESVIAEGTPNIARPRGAVSVDEGTSKILQVSTGVDPLLRTYGPCNGNTPPSATTLTSDVYVDTLVQFTVTPYTDPVTPHESDKLMIYLKEHTNTVSGAIAGTNLVVVGGYCIGDGEFEAKEYMTSVEIKPNTWHRLTVKVIKDFGELGGNYRHPAFQVFLDGDSNPCVFDSPAVASDEYGYVTPFDGGASELDEATVVFSLLCDGSTDATLQGVGFAGEGKVDDIVFSTGVNPFATVFDFTFAFGSGVSAVTYTVGGVEYDQARTFPEVEANTQVAITDITYADDYMEGSTTAVNLSGPVEGVYTVTNAGASLTITPAEAYASIGDTKYGTFAAAITGATAGQTVTLLRDAAVSGNTISTAAGTLDLNGKTLTLPQDSKQVASLTFTGTGAKTLKGGDLTGIYHELTITAPAGENLTFDGMTFHASVKPNGSGALFTATDCQFLCDFDKTGAAFTDGSSADVHSYGVLFTDDSKFTQADIVDNYFDQGRRAAVQASFAGDLYFYGNTVVAEKLTSRKDGATTRYPALQIFSNGRVFMENNTFAGQYLGEAFCMYAKEAYRFTDNAIVFNGNTVSNGVNYLWGVFDSAATGVVAVAEANVLFGANTIGDQVDLTKCIYKTTIDDAPYGPTPATLALPTGVASVYAWTHAAGAKDFYVNGTAADSLSGLVAEDVVLAVPGADVSGANLDLTPDATYKNKWTAKSSDSWNTPSDDASVADSLEDDGFPASATNLVTSVSEFNAFVQYITNKVSGAAAPADLTAYEKANAALCYALNATAIPDAELTDADVTIDSIEKNADGSVALTVAIKGVTVGETVAPALLAKVVTAKGGTELGSLSSANVTVNGYGAEDGKVVITVEPAQALGTPTSFFMQTVINK